MVKNVFRLASVVAAAAITLLMAASTAPAAPLPDNPIVAASTAAAPDMIAAATPAADRLVVAHAVEPVTLVSGGVFPARGSLLPARRVALNDANSAQAIVGGASRPALWPPIAT